MNLPHNIKFLRGNMTLNEIEKAVKGTNFGYIFHRGISIRDLNKTLVELEKEKNSLLSFNLLKQTDKLIIDLEESEINFINIEGKSCYQSATLQGFVHILFPLAIKYVNRETQKKGYPNVNNLDELKNENLFNNTVIDTIKEVLEIQGCGNGGVDKEGSKRVEALELFKIAPPFLLGGGDENAENISDVNNLNGKNIDQSKLAMDAINCISDKLDKINSNPPKKTLMYKIFTGKDLVKNIEIKKKTIMSEIMKMKIQGNNKYYGNLVLRFTNEDLNDHNLDICKLLQKCPLLYNNKLIETNEVIYMITDRILDNDTIKKNFVVYEKIYLDKINGAFSSSNLSGYNSILYELNFVIFHRFFDQYSGHYIAYSKIRGKWHEFNDLDDDYSIEKNPPLYDNFQDDFYPISFYYTKKEK